MLLAACRVSCSRKVTVLRICSCGHIYLSVFSSIAAAGWCKQSNTHSLRSLVVTNIWWGWGQRKVLSSQLGSSAFCLLECFDTFGLITVKAAGPLKACSTYPQRFSFRLLEKRTKRCWLTWKMLLKWRSWSFSCFRSHNAIDWASGRQLYTKTTLSIYRAFFSTCWRMELLRWMWKIAAKLFSVHVCMVTDKFECSTGNLWPDLHHSWTDYSAGRPADVARPSLNCHRVVSLLLWPLSNFLHQYQFIFATFSFYI